MLIDDDHWWWLFPWANVIGDNVCMLNAPTLLLLVVHNPPEILESHGILINSVYSNSLSWRQAGEKLRFVVLVDYDLVDWLGTSQSVEDGLCLSCSRSPQLTFRDIVSITGSRDLECWIMGCIARYSMISLVGVKGVASFGKHGVIRSGWYFWLVLKEWL